MIRSCIIASLLSFSLCLLGQLTTWKTEDGLSNEWISDIVQDSSGYIWMGTQYGLSRFDGYEFSSINYIPNDPNALSGNWVRSMHLDQKGKIYVNCYFGGLHLLDPQTGRLERIMQTADGALPISIKKIFVDRSNNLWVGGDKFVFKKSPKDTFLQKVPISGGIDFDQTKNGLIFILSENKISIYKDKIEAILSFDDDFYQQIFIDNDDKVWLLSNSGISRLLKQEDSWEVQPFKIPDYNEQNVFYKTAIFEDHLGTIWIAGEQGVSHISKDRESVRYSLFEELFENLEPNLEILSFLEDKHSNIWLGTNRGLHMLPHNHDRFEVDDPLSNQISNVTGARSLQQIRNKAWVGTERGLYEISHKREIKLILNKPVYALYLSKDSTLYIGTSDGMYELQNIHTSNVYRITPEDQTNLLIWNIAEDKAGNIWNASRGGIHRYNPEKKTFTFINAQNNLSLGDTNFQGIVFDKDGNLWAGSLSSGIYQLTNTYEFTNPESANFINYQYDENNPNSISSNIALCMASSGDGSIWVGTDGGLNQITNDGIINKFLKNPKLIDDKFMSIKFDNNNTLWASTIGHGIMAMDLSTESTTFFNRRDGLVSNNYLLNSGFINDSGILFFGSDAETQVINTNTALTQTKIKTDFLFTELNYLTNTIDTFVCENISTGQTIKIPDSKSTFSISFSTIQFNQSIRTEYQYRILPIFKTWQSNGPNRKITFNNLKHGDYELEVRAINPNLDLQPAVISLNLNILPPWWQSQSAYFIYLLGLLGLIFIIINRIKEQAEVSKVKELNQLKTKLFTNITHEIRTPLTVILGLSKKLMGTQKKSIAESSEIIFRNGNHLLLLINRMLDLSKIESGKMPITLEQDDIISYIAYLLESFKSLSEDKDIRLHFLPKEAYIIMDYDAEIIKQILNNLISNAIKYSPVGSDIYCQIERNQGILNLSIKDTGKGIEAQNLPHLFERFYQEEAAQNSSGIGLAITKELLELLDGSISVSNNPNKGCTFLLKFPISNNAPKIGSTQNEVKPTLIFENPSTLDQILIVEDNLDIAQYIEDSLKGRFSTVIANDGKSGLLRAKELIPDLIISDLMMPHMSGTELCNNLKKDPITNHIPIIILTAKADQNSKNVGLKSGADAYLTKPFDADELLIQIDNLLNLRRTLRLKYSDATLSKSQEGANSADPFIIELVTLIKNNLSNSKFDINHICRHLAISRVHLHRKLKALTGKSTSIFIREIRLSTAHQLLISTDLNISEVSYEVGYSDPAYFSKLFSEKFGMPPSQIKK